MMILYHCISARSFRPLWALEELGLPYELKMLPFPPRALAREYLAVNPLGTVPALFDGALCMTESAAICQYLASRFGKGNLDVAQDDPDYGRYLNWLHLGEATLTFPQTLVLRYGRFEPQDRKQPQVVEDYSRWFLARLRAVDAVVARQDFLCAQRFTAADISVGYALMLADYLGMAERFSEAVLRYWQRLQQRDGFQRALAAQEKAALAQGVSPVPAPLADPAA
ncbi:glutathione S-transferase family protein [Noviherbaspirillum sp. Root189]|uniref:glutathione S-transferase family protein n=1 Tax=Noviherbaspirillum sp. Root189 TaxID=1736487 RepID=UPI00070B4256|nr:glutathione S-transferase family protein [Noviherbaspirillum sp. Root189]KRB84684.1 glutathione S-transferase [Noviherbaspirillum sp. Root189]